MGKTESLPLKSGERHLFSFFSHSFLILPNIFEILAKEIRKEKEIGKKKPNSSDLQVVYFPQKLNSNIYNLCLFYILLLTSCIQAINNVSQDSQRICIVPDVEFKNKIYESIIIKEISYTPFKNKNVILLSQYFYLNICY